MARIRPIKANPLDDFAVHCRVQKQQTHLAVWTVCTNTHMHTKHHSTFVCSHLFRSATFALLFGFLSLCRFSQIPREDGSLRIAQLQFLDKSHTRGPHHSVTSEDFATDIHHVEHAEEYLNTLQPCALRSHYPGRIHALTTSTPMTITNETTHGGNHG